MRRKVNIPRTEIQKVSDDLDLQFAEIDKRKMNEAKAQAAEKKKVVIPKTEPVARVSVKRGKVYSSGFIFLAIILVYFSNTKNQQRNLRYEIIVGVIAVTLGYRTRIRWWK